MTPAVADLADDGPLEPNSALSTSDVPKYNSEPSARLSLGAQLVSAARNGGRLQVEPAPSISPEQVPASTDDATDHEIPAEAPAMQEPEPQAVEHPEPQSFDVQPVDEMPVATALIDQDIATENIAASHEEPATIPVEAMVHSHMTQSQSPEHASNQAPDAVVSAPAYNSEDVTEAADQSPVPDHSSHLQPALQTHVQPSTVPETLSQDQAQPLPQYAPPQSGLAHDPHTGVPAPVAAQPPYPVAPTVPAVPVGAPVEHAMPTHQGHAIQQPPQPVPQPVAVDPHTGMPIQPVHQQQPPPQAAPVVPTAYVDPNGPAPHPNAAFQPVAYDPYTGQPIQVAPVAVPTPGVPIAGQGHAPVTQQPAAVPVHPALQPGVQPLPVQAQMPHHNSGTVPAASVPVEPLPAATPPAESGERSQRRRIFKGIKIGFGNDYCAVDGVMRNISETGAFIEVKDGFLVPDEISIQNELEGYKVKCEVVRREANRIGVRFIGEKQKIQSTKHQVVNMIEADDPANLAREEQQQEIIRPRSGPAKKPVFGQRRL